MFTHISLSCAEGCNATLAGKMTAGTQNSGKELMLKMGNKVGLHETLFNHER
jgi:hypothetical protein